MIGLTTLLVGALVYIVLSRRPTPTADPRYRAILRRMNLPTSPDNP
jgi:hypothetical protein